MKKKNKKKLNDRYWQGVQAGMMFALNSPNEAKKYVNNIDLLRARAEKGTEVLKKLSDILGSLFNR